MIDPAVQRYLDVSIDRSEEGLLSKVKIKAHPDRYWDLAYILRDRKGEMLHKITFNLEMSERKLGPEFEHFIIRNDDPEIDKVREVYVTRGLLPPR